MLLASPYMAVKEIYVKNMPTLEACNEIHNLIMYIHGLVTRVPNCVLD